VFLDLLEGADVYYTVDSSEPVVRTHPEDPSISHCLNGRLYNHEDGIMIEYAPAFVDEVEKGKTLRTLCIRAVAVAEKMLPSSELRRECKLEMHVAGRGHFPHVPHAPYFWREGRILPFLVS
jgi:hypothetical protein